MSGSEHTLSGKIALVSGSSSGIGAAIARELAARGAVVIVNHPNSSTRHEAEAVVASLATPGCFAVEADLSTIEGPAHLVAATVAAFGRVDVLVNSASLAVNAPLAQQTLADWDRLVNLNGRGYFLLTQACLPHFPSLSESQRVAGIAPNRLINILSVSARGPPPGQTIYAGTKGMQDAFTKCWAKELPAQYGVTVNAVSPGPTKTEGFAAAGEEAMKILQPTIDAIPVGKRMGMPEEVAYAVGCLAEPRASWINGVCIQVNGGLFID